jgi:hypothetical protein
MSQRQAFMTLGAFALLLAPLPHQEIFHDEGTFSGLEGAATTQAFHRSIGAARRFDAHHLVFGGTVRTINRC